MPPSSRGHVFLSIIRRHASTSAPNKVPVKPTVTKPTSTSKSPSHPSRSKPGEHQLHSPRIDSPEVNSNASQSFHHGFRKFFHDPKYRFARRAILVTPALFLAILHSPYEFMTANGQSMSPFLNPNSSDGLPTKDRVLVQRWHSTSEKSGQRKKKDTVLNEEVTTQFQRGQIVVFPTPHNPERIAVKRIVAIPGDMVQPLPGYADGDGPVVVPWNHVWVEGDAGRRSESMDSNWYGPISQNLILGEVKAVLPSWLNWNWLDWRQHTWPAREKGRVDENAIMEAAVDPDAVNYTSGWRNGAIALVLERMRRQPEHVLYAFVNDAKARQETRRLYNNALYVAEVANSEQEKQLAKDLTEEMEDVYGREALVFGIRIKRRLRDRGELPNVENSRIGEKVLKDEAASEAEEWLKKQGWQLERDGGGTVKTQESKPR